MNAKAIQLIGSTKAEGCSGMPLFVFAHRANALKFLLGYNIIIKSSESRKFTAFFYENKTKACYFVVFFYSANDAEGKWLNLRL
jgi:hypothetical protein